MIKFETVGMNDVAKINPVLKSESDVHNYDFIENDGILYLIINNLTGDDAGKTEAVLKAGTYLRGYNVAAFADQKLVIDIAHIDLGEQDALAVEDIIKLNSNNELEYAAEAPTSGIYFKVTDIGASLTGPAVKAVVVCAEAAAESAGNP